MPINKENSCSASVVFEKETYEKLREIARKNKRSISKQIAFWVEQKLSEPEQ